MFSTLKFRTLTERKKAIKKGICKDFLSLADSYIDVALYHRASAGNQGSANERRDYQKSRQSMEVALSILRAFNSVSRPRTYSFLNAELQKQQ